MIVRRRLMSVVLGASISLVLVSTSALSVTLPSTAQSGDLIFREGTEGVSDMVRAVDGGPYSHVGLLVGEHGRWQVLHATPSEVPGRPDGVVLDDLSFFIDRQRAKHYAVYHVEASQAQRELAIKTAYEMLGKPFRVADASGTYCTMLVWGAWQRGGLDLDVAFTHLALPLMNGKYLLPSALLASSKVRAIYSTEVSAP